jgi:serine protease Do
MFTKEIKKLRTKMKKNSYKIIIQAVLINLVLMVLFFGAIFLLFYSNRSRFVDYLVGEYRKEEAKIDSVEIPFISEKENIKEEVDEKVEIVLPIKEEEKKEVIPTVIDAVKKAKPAVVSILVSDKLTKKKLGSGSGFIISSDGLIVTNRHVVSEKEAKFLVLLNSGKEYEAELLDFDPVLDVALIKIKESGLPYLELHDSDTLEVGETVIAIGNALGEFKNTVSVGVVSGLSRSITALDNSLQKEYLDKVIQTDAAINKGNSGGPLLNIYGKVVGINVAVVEKSSSIGFSLPINSVKDAINSVRTTGKIIRPFVGVRYVFSKIDLNLENNVSYEYGITIEKGANKDDVAVMPNSPAEKAGLKEGDIILEIDGIKISENNDLAHLIRSKKIGDFVTMKIYSDKLVKTVFVTLAQAPDNL